jgi:hypothetical protein
MMEEESDEDLEALSEFIQPTEEKRGYCYKGEGASVFVGKTSVMYMY